MTPPTIEVVTPDQAQILADLHAGSIDPPWNREAFASLLGQPGVLGLLARGDGGPAGFILLRQAADEAEILTLAVGPAKRRCGIGKILLSEAISRLSGLGVQRLFLEVADDNAAALALYRQAGFSQVGRRPDYYRRAGQGAANALVLEKRL
ncbi:MAG: ribosomal protein S18-alanine N-acetyltransferase [Rhodospirillales bacterium]|nr:ribosomal protein S18-alanine N-acetyltransferase [Rhodospirillales bacterium]